MKRKRTVATLLVGVVVLGVLAPSIGGLSAAATQTASGEPTYNTTQTESFDNLSTHASDNVTVRNGKLVLTEKNVSIDDYEDGDVAEYQGDTGNISTTNSTVFEGSNALHFNGNGSWQQFFANKNSGLPHNVSQGTSFVTYAKAGTDEASIFGIVFGSREKKQAYYRVVFADSNDEIRLELDNRSAGGSKSTLDNASLDRDVSQWHKIRVDWHANGDINVTISDPNGTVITKLSDNDNTFTEGGIGGVMPNTNEQFYLDGFKLKNDTDPGYVVKKYDTSETVRRFYLDTTGSGYSAKVKIGSSGSYKSISNADWKDVPDGEDVYVKYDLTSEGASIDGYSAEWRTWSRQVLLNEDNPATMRIAAESSNAVMHYDGSVLDAKDVSANVSIDFSEDANFTLQKLNRSATDGTAVANFSANATSGEMVLKLQNLSADTNYTIYQDSEKWKTVESNTNGTLTIVKESGWSKHSFGVVASSSSDTSDSTDDGGILGSGDDSCTGLSLPVLGCLPPIVLGSATGVLLVIALAIYAERRMEGS